MILRRWEHLPLLGVDTWAHSWELIDSFIVKQALVLVFCCFSFC